MSLRSWSKLILPNGCFFRTFISCFHRVIIQNVNDIPTVKFNGGDTWNVDFTEGFGPVSVASNIEVADQDIEDTMTLVFRKLFRHKFSSCEVDVDLKGNDGSRKWRRRRSDAVCISVT